MKKWIPTIFFLGLIAWGASLWIVALGHADPIAIGRDRSFGITMNLISLVTTIGGLLWAVAKARVLLIPMTIAVGVWIKAFLVFGFLPYVTGLFGAPSEEKIRATAEANGYSNEWIEKALCGPAMSAATEYMVDVYQWELLAEVKQPQ
jgi:hypothetical protein